MESIEINGVEYVKKSDARENAIEFKGMKYCMVRTYSAGVFAGYLKYRDNKEVELVLARRIWRWEGAASLSQLAMEGTSKPDKCKFPCEVNSILLTEVIEIIECTEKARLSIASVPVWSE